MGAENIRDFLDSRSGRYLADEVCNCGSIADIDPKPWKRGFLEFALENGLGGELVAQYHRKNAQKALDTAEASLRSAEAALKRILEALPPEGAESTGGHSLKEFADTHLDMIRAYFGE